MRTSLNNQVTQLRNLEVQMGKIDSLFNERQQGNLPSDESETHIVLSSFFMNS